MRGLGRLVAALATVSLAGLVGSGAPHAGDRNGWDYPYFPERLMPEDGAPIQSDGKLTGSGTDEHANVTLTGRTPLYQGHGLYLMLQGDGQGTWFDQGDDQAWGGDVGLILRGALDPNNAWGVNAFVDLGSEGAFAGQGSVGLEYEYVSDGGMSLRAGGNAYIPFQDYTANEDFLRAPRLGGDLYLGIGQDIRWHRLELFVTGFHYTETDDVESLSGMTVEAEWRYGGLDFLPPGSHLYVAMGGRWDTLDHDISPIGRIGIAFPLGNDGSQDRVAEIRRNIAFGSAFVPLQRKPKAGAGSDPTDLGCGPGNPSFEESFFAAVSLVDGGGGRFEPSGTVGDFIPAQEILDSCNGVSGCAAAISAIPAPIPLNFGNYAYYEKGAQTCEFNTGVAGGE